MEKKYTIILIVMLLIVCLIAATVTPKKSKPRKEKLLGINYKVEGNEASLDKYDTENPVVAMYVEKYGSIVMELYPSDAPNTVNNFISLVKSGFYDNNSFHRLMSDFVLQGGDPDGNGSGGPDYYIKGEFSDNGVDNKLSHTKGMISMARSSENDSAGSQFFIVLADSTELDGKYAVFGKIIDGWDNVEAIAENESVKDASSGTLSKNLTIKKALIDVKGKDYPEPEKIEK